MKLVRDLTIAAAVAYILANVFYRWLMYSMDLGPPHPWYLLGIG